MKISVKEKIILALSSVGKTVLTCFGTRLSGTVYGHLDRLRQGGHLRRRRLQHDRQGEALPWKQKWKWRTSGDERKNYRPAVKREMGFSEWDDACSRFGSVARSKTIKAQTIPRSLVCVGSIIHIQFADREEREIHPISWSCSLLRSTRCIHYLIE